MKVFLLMTKSNMVLTFRKKLIEALKEKECEVGVIAQDADFKEEIEKLGVKFYCVKSDNRSLNPFAMFRYKKAVAKILKEEKPDKVFTFQLMPNTFGVKGAKKAKIKSIYSMVEGAGDVFINNSIKWKVIRFVVCKLYKSAFKNSEKVFFLNNDDKTEFLARKLVKEEKCVVIHGIGVDLEHFAFKPIKNDRTFLMIARLLKTKGVYEYCNCARLVKQKYPDAKFNYLGGEGTIKIADIKEYIDDGSINYLGTAKDVRPYLEDCTALMLPSYREGVPMSVMEAESTGRAIIVSDRPGCRDTVDNEYNGFIVEQTDYETMAKKCIFMIENFDKTIEMGKNARTFAEENFDSKKINDGILKVLEI